MKNVIHLTVINIKQDIYIIYMYHTNVILYNNIHTVMTICTIMTILLIHATNNN